MYADFAAYYDELMSEVDYGGWAAYYSSLLDGAGVRRGGPVTECACGTGGLTVHLARLYSLTGVDRSQEMLSLAAAKLRAAGLTVPLVCQDMRRLRLMRPQDALLCTCDGVNYLTDESALSAFLRSARAALGPGGALAFDVSSPYKLSAVLGNNTLASTRGRVHYIWENAWHEKSGLLDLRLQLYARQEDGLFRHAEEIQRQKAWREDELRAALLAGGFGGIRIFGDRTDRPPRAEEERWHIVAIRT